ncbi:MAG: hypothetical protein ACI9WU_000676 [Myxococcota bacterium]
MFWSNQGVEEGVADLESFEGSQQEAVTTGQFPARFALDLYTQPPASAISAAAEDGIARGLLSVYVDTDEDGVWTPSTDTTVGFADAWLLTWSGSTGYQVMRITLDAVCGDDGLGLKPAKPGGDTSADRRSAQHEHRPHRHRLRLRSRRAAGDLSAD